MQLRKLKLIIFFVILCQISYSQINKKQNIFSSPVNFPIKLAGTFGELRSGHFHSGIDIKTKGKCGEIIKAVSNGYISRIKVSTNGYGKTIYISHPNNRTSVYGHLSKFNNKISKYVKDYQYKNKTFEVNIFPESNKFTIKKGDIIGFSGNTGSSRGPHLHFELRKTSNQHPINPLLFLDVKDNIAPKIYYLACYPMEENSTINSKNKSLIIPAKLNDNNYIIANNLKLSGKIGFGIETYDYLNDSRNKCGITNLKLKINNKLIFEHKINEFAFSETRYINSHIDYEEKEKSNKKIQKTFIEPNNNLSTYLNTVNNGIYNFDDSTNYNIKILVNDIYNNTSILEFNAIGSKQKKIDTPAIQHDSINKILWDKDFLFKNDKIQIRISKYSLYKNLNFNYYISQAIPNTFSSLHHIHNIYTPLQKPISLSIHTNNIPEGLKEKALIVRIDKDGEKHSIGGDAINSHITGITRKFGNYTVMIDTIAPKIIPLFTSTKFENKSKINFKITDKLAGIKTYNGYIDNKWVLFEYDLKNKLLFFTFDKDKILKNTNHELEIFVIDNKNNIETYYTSFYW
ncbi:MAG: M23 family metallopeptidase [Bacteroidota bacterium]|nr:M23 family metallopeptidase [Bacteroidota bacterium]